jgi:tetratricopeptide (TPR) repeat protein
VARGKVYNKLGLYEECYSDNIRAKKCSSYSPEKEACVIDALTEGRACLKKRDNEAAVSFFSRVVYLAPDHIQALLQRAVAYRRLGRHKEACKDYRKVVGSLARTARYPQVLIVMAVCQEGHKVLTVYPDTARGYRRAKVFMERFREDKRQQERRLDGEWHLVDLELFEGSPSDSWRYGPYILVLDNDEWN